MRKQVVRTHLEKLQLVENGRVDSILQDHERRT